MRKVTAVLAAAVAALALAATAMAATGSLPSFKSHLIVPNRSVGGVVLKSSAASAVRTLGASRSCSVDNGCVFTKNGANFSVQFARLTAHSKPIVASISMNVEMTGSGTPVFTTPLVALKTASGIGLGSTAAAVKHAYPAAKGSPKTGYAIVGADAHQTTFTLVHGRVTTISMAGVHLG